ncbi:MAG: PQQ-binding-like beta-propeller repeat protein [Chitinophagaceae bacterium]
MINRIFFLSVSLLICSSLAYTQSFKFAFLSDTHIGVKNADEDLRRSVADINADTSLKFVIITGDITELGTDEEILLAKGILSKLKKPLYIQTGNHDANWSPNAGRIFNSAFGLGRFSFQYNGYLFIGTNSGPIMHHKAPGQVPREDILWMDSILNDSKNQGIPVVYTNHYPQDSTQKNWFEALERLKKKNVQLILVGHGHLNNKFIFEGIPGIMGRSNLRAADSIGAYNIATISNGRATFQERMPCVKTKGSWAEVALVDHRFQNDTVHYSRPTYAINSAFPQVKVLWKFEDNYDIGAGTAVYNNFIIATNTRGEVFALDKVTGQKKWSFKTNGKIYSTPAVSSRYAVIGSTDSVVYCLNAGSGKLIWKYKAFRPIVASPEISNGLVYIGGSDGHFRAINLFSGKMKWDFKGVKDFIMTKPLLYNNNVYFGSWGNEFYALNASNGTFLWKWKDTSNNRMFSPAGARPVAAHDKVFIVAPDQYMTAFDASNGNIAWRTKMPTVKARESMGLSSDSSLVYVKTTEGKLVGIATTSPEMKSVFNINLQLGYDICASPVVEDNTVIYVPSNSGVVNAVDRQTGKLLWKHKISNSNVTSITPLSKNQVIISTVDGKIACLNFTRY